MKDQAAALLGKEMDRKEFLRFIGLGTMLLFGGGIIINALGNLSSASKSTLNKGAKSMGAANTSYGYGSSVYGGVRR